MKSIKKLRWLFILFAWLLSSCHAGGAPQDKPHTAADATNDPLIRAMRIAGDIGDQVSDLFHGVPRKVLPGATPELLVENNRITFNGKLLVLEAPVAEWWKVLGPPSRQDRNGRVQVWDDLGLSLTAKMDKATDDALTVLIEQSHSQTSQGSKAKQIDVDQAWGEVVNKARSGGRFEVSSFSVRLRSVPGLPENDEDGKPVLRQVFKGYLEVNGVGVDGKSTLRDVFRWSQKTKYPLYYGCLRIEELRRCTAHTEITEDVADMNFAFSVDETKQRNIISFGFSCEGCPRPAR